MGRDRKNVGWISAIAVFLALLGGSATAAPIASDQEAVRNAFTHWMADFNARRVDRICSLFAPELRYDYRGFPERNYQQICSGLHDSLTDPTRQYRYALEIKDIMVSGRLAVARVVWTLTVTPHSAPKPTISREYSMDVLRKQADGSWKIVRFTAYEAP